MSGLSDSNATDANDYSIVVLADTITPANKLAILADGSANARIANAAGAGAVNIQDGGNSITVDSAQWPATLGRKTMALSFSVTMASDQGAFPVSQSGTWNITNISGVISLPTGAATAALQTTGNTTLTSINTSLTSINAKIPPLGQNTMANSTPVVFASNQSALTVQGTVSVAQTGVCKSFYSEVSAVGSASLVSVATYTVPVGTQARLQRVDFSGSNIAEYQLFINAVLQEKKRAWFSSLNDSFQFSGGTAEGLLLSAGTVVTLRVIHSRPDVGDFNGRIQVLEI
jgi:hypothetical protein